MADKVKIIVEEIATGYIASIEGQADKKHIDLSMREAVGGLILGFRDDFNIEISPPPVTKSGKK
ncbi:MAG: hypothetical protein V1712_02265 [Patescibacteria group bacterium]